MQVEDDLRLSAAGCHAFLLQSEAEIQRTSFVITDELRGESRALVFGESVYLLAGQGWLSAGTRGEVFVEKLAVVEDKAISKFRKWSLVSRKPLPAQRPLYCTDEFLLKSAFGNFLSVENSQLVARSSTVEEAALWCAHDSSRLPLPDWALARAGQWTGPLIPGVELLALQRSWRGSQATNRLRFESLREAEEHVLEEVVFALLGAPGQLVVRREGGEWALEQAGQLEPGFAGLIARVLPVAGFADRVQRFQRAHSNPAHGLQLQALAAALSAVRREFLGVVHRLEVQLRQKELDAQKLMLQLAPSAKNLALLARLLEAVEGREAPPLSVIGKWLVAAPDAQSAALFRFLFAAAARPLLAQVHQWVTLGVLDDLHREFFVVAERGADPRALDGFRLLSARVPAHLARHAEKVLEAGRLALLLREYDPKRVAPARDELLAAAALEPDSPLVPAAVEAALQGSQREVLALFFGAERVLERLHSLRQFFFLGAADYLIHFLDLAEQELRKPAKAVSVEKLQNFFELAVRSSAAANDPFREQVSVELAGALVTDAAEALGRAETAAERNVSGRKGYDLLALRVAVPWPCSLLLGAQHLAKYQVVSRYLFLLKFFERQLCAAWLAFQEHKQLGGRQLRIVRWIMHKAIFLSKALLQHALHEVVHPRVEEAMRQMRAADSFAQLCALHAQMLDDILRDSLLADKQFRLSVWTLNMFFGFVAENNREFLDKHFAFDYRALMLESELSSAENRRALAEFKQRKLGDIVAQGSFAAELQKINAKLNELRANLLAVLLERQRDCVPGLSALIEAFSFEDATE